MVTAILLVQAAALPPPFPRPGTTKLLENDAVAVWNVSWLKRKFPLHTHRYDLVGIAYEEGDRIITQGDGPGRLVPTKAWAFQTNRAGVTHVEEGASDPPMRAVLIEVKTPAPREAARSRPTACARSPVHLRGKTTGPRPGWSWAARRSPRIATSATPSNSYSMARHRRRRSSPLERFTQVRRPAGGARAYIFEIK